jgi:hypothetical protein
MKKLRAIIVDDQPNGVVKGHKNALVDLGWDVLLVDNVDTLHGLLLDIDDPCDLLIIDIWMPGGQRFKPHSGRDEDTGFDVFYQVLIMEALTRKPLRVGVLTQLDPGEVRRSIDKLVEDKGAHPSWPFDIWAKSLAADVFAREISNWYLRTMTSVNQSDLNKWWPNLPANVTKILAELKRNM